MRSCQRCGGEVSWTDDTVTLFWGVVAHLCNPCRTEWNRVLSEHPLWLEVERNDARGNHYSSLALAQQPVTEDAWAELRHDKGRLEREAHALGVEFVNAKVGAAAASEDGVTGD